ncbi:GyrI-like domain-containing protein [Companilactobacillus kimchiensis]|uniref:GyrI-like small molecule binding domain-containing protein n=1 Tax=Companilactobacillus kimchiensis TaxID=993692 RepID=A0A0R2LAT8_9LACO|nr:GyrI-like domain-containing protein [Companilactobacillus kimchiensis]KRN99039.1 hypothetical protein IV57_GL000609 [Companilactobacillus kimchiensis]
MKYEWRKQEKELYTTKKNPVILLVPGQKFISLHGIGDPNGSNFQDRIQTLYPAAYGIKAAYKKYCLDKKVEFNDYTVFPLEGIWSLTNKGQQLDYLDKNEFSYDIMIRVPNFVPQNLLEPTLQEIKSQKKLSLIDKIEIKKFEPMQVAQVLHVGSYDDEPASFQKIDQLVKSEGKKRISKIHREIYLSDARRAVPDKLKTILRYRIK